ncbi:MAG: hypothetical protein HC800_15030 [Phormidesmis sp. RL_2_1]|nr:hypothetical protein [Phormidesmis sp. RL_2_1]
MQLNIRLDLTSTEVRLLLLDGLDHWVRLGLLSESQILELAQLLSVPLPSLTNQATQAELFAPYVPPVAAQMASATQVEQENLLEQPPSGLSSGPQLPVNKVTRLLRALLDEISVIWLLFLGVFLVVVSSGVLAASQWQSFSPVGQYAVLLAYTLVFWGASLWAKAQANLQATARMLALTTLLLIPINFWMIDALGVLAGPIGIGIGGLSALLLSCLPLRLLTHRSIQLNVMALSWLHLGWLGGWLGGWSGGWPVAATYLAAVGTALNLIYQDRQSHLTREPAELEEPDASVAVTTSRLLPFDVLTLALSVVILLFRSLLIAQVPSHQLGLAAGICGWLLVWLARSKANHTVWDWAGLGLLLLGWAMTVTQQRPGRHYVSVD